MNLTKIDWLGFRTQAEIPAALAALQGAYGSVGEHLKPIPRKRGWMGYEQAADLSLGGMQVGLIAYGGENQRGWVSVNITGRGCEWMRDWEQADDALGRLPGYQNRRVDIALDTYKRETSHEGVLAAYRAGQFAIHGRPPSLSQIVPEDPTEGRTIYIGKRDQGKFLRAYEKGYQLAKDYPVEVSHIDGAPIEDIYRLEVEFKAKNSVLPLDIVDKRDQYFAGAYPYLQSVLAVEPEIFTQARERGPQRDLEAALENIRYQYGSTLFTALTAFHGDVGAVWEKIVGKKDNEALVALGVLLVDHA
jgi:phage replication initiation protein